MVESALFAPSYQLRDMFVTFLMYNGVDSPKDRWERCWKSMSDDILYKKKAKFGHDTLELDDAQLEQYTLMEVEKIMRTHEKSLNNFTGIQKINSDFLKQLGNSLCNQELDYDVGEEDKKHNIQYGQLNSQQLAVYDVVLSSVEKNEGKLFFVNGAGGTGKTFLYQTIISRLRSRKQIVLAVASTGIVALFLPNGRTSHSHFNIPIDLTEETLCRIKSGTMLAELIYKTDMIIWDESPMTHKHAF